MAYNASQQKSPICNDLRKSEWVAEYGGMRFWFSTPTHLAKFNEQVRIKVEWLNDSMCKRFHFRCDFTDVALVQLYMAIEGRGFRILDVETSELYEDADEFMVFTCHRNTIWNDVMDDGEAQ